MTNEEKYEKYRDEFNKLDDNFKERIEIGRKLLDSVQVDQLKLQLEYGSIYGKISAFFKNCEVDSEEAYSKAFIDAMSDAYKDRSATEARHHAQSNPDYINKKKFENRVFRLKKRVENRVETIETRKYTLKDLTAAILAGVEKHII